MEETKICPHCGQQIKSVAKKCRYCQTWLDEPVRPQATRTQPSSQEPSKGNSSKYIIIGVVAVIVIALAWYAYWVNNSGSDSDYSYQEERVDTVLIEEVPVELIEQVQPEEYDNYSSGSQQTVDDSNDW